MKIWKNTILSYLGGMTYCSLELLWRGRSHGSMFVLGGICFLGLGKLGRLPLPFWTKAILGSLFITAGELATGLLVNRQYGVWDYRGMALNFQGQICLLYSLFWLALSPVAWTVHDFLEERLPQA